jgi:hypothetical protein
MPLILGTNSIKDTGYDVANSLRFDRGSSASLNRTFGTPTNSKKLTISFWTKFMAESGNDHHAFANGDSNADESLISFINSGNHNLEIKEDISSSPTYQFVTNRVFRDPSAWMHIVIAWDSSQGTESNRLKLYINGTQETSLATANYPNLNQDIKFNTNIAQYIGKMHRNEGRFFNGYLAETVLIDGQQLAADQFGEFDSDSSTIWKPKDVSGLTFGTNGFYLDFEDSSNLGNDANGGTDLTATNLTATDQSTDTCTNNFATFNGALGYNSTIALAEGNLKGTTPSTHEALCGSIFSSIGVTQGKWYAEFKVTTNSNHSVIGISADMESDAAGDAVNAYNFIYLGQGLGYYGANGKIFHTNSNTQMTYGSALSNNDIVGIAMDVDNQEVYFSVNGTFQNSGNPASGSSKTGGVVKEGARNIFSTGTGTLFFAVADFDRDATCAIEANFGGSVSAISSGNADANGYGNFEYAVPSGYYSLNTKNLAEFG